MNEELEKLKELNRKLKEYNEKLDKELNSPINKLTNKILKPHVVVENIHKKALKVGLITKAQELLKVPYKTVTDTDLDGKTTLSTTAFLSRTANNAQEEKEYTRKLVEAVNEIAERGYMRGVLCGFSTIKLVNPESAIVDLDPLKMTLKYRLLRLYHSFLRYPKAVFVFPHVTPEGAEFVKAKYSDLWKLEGHVEQPRKS